MPTSIELREKADGLRAKAKEVFDSADELSAEAQEQFDGLLNEADEALAQAARADRLERLEASMGESRGRVTEQREPDAEPVHSDIRKYSLLRAMRLSAQGRVVDGLEGEVSAEVAKSMPSGYAQKGSFFIPWNLPMEKYDVTSSNLSGFVGTDTRGQDFIELLRNRMVVQQLGARMLTGLVGDVALPKQTGGATAYWINNESATITESNQTGSTVAYSPNTLGAATDITRKLMLQSSVDAERFVREDLAMTIALELDRAALNGSGSGSEPEGLLQNSSVNSVAIGANGGAPTFAHMVDMETEVAADNADIGGLAYVTTPGVRGKLKQTEKASNTAQFVWNDGQVNGYRAEATNQMPSNLTKAYGSSLHGILFGNWNDLIIAQWGSGVDVLVDPYSNSLSGAVRVVLYHDVDIAPRHDVSFCKIVDADIS